MERENDVSVEVEAKQSDIFSRHPLITEILELIFNHPEAKKEIRGTLFDFWDIYEKCFSQDENYCEFDVLCMYALDYVYKRNGPTQSSVSRSVYCYIKQVYIHRENRSAIIDCTEQCFVKTLRKLSNFNSTEGENILIDILIKSLLGGNLGLSMFLVKFGLVEFPSEANGKSWKIVQRLVKWLNTACSSNDLLENIPEVEGESINLDDLFYQMEQNKNATFRRLLFILCYICIIAEYRTVDKLALRSHVNMKFLCFRKLECLSLFIETTTETSVTFKDVDQYLSTILYQQLKEEVRKSLRECAKKIFCETSNCYQPRPLKHLARSKIRECLRNSTVLPVEVDQLQIPLTLKEFVTFEEKEIWKALKNDQTVFYFLQNINRILSS